MTKRTCDGCTACCEGWLNGEVKGHTFHAGKPCFFKSAKGCSIYEDRPDDPCKIYKCAWISEDIFPMWMRPDLSKVLITKRTLKEITYYDIIEAGETMKSYVLNYIIQYALNNKINIKYMIDGGVNKIGSREFSELDLK